MVNTNGSLLTIVYSAIKYYKILTNKTKPYSIAITSFDVDITRTLIEFAITNIVVDTVTRLNRQLVIKFIPVKLNGATFENI